MQFFVFCIFQGLNEEDFLVRYESAIDILIELEPLGYSAAVITQVEIADFNLSWIYLMTAVWSVTDELYFMLTNIHSLLLTFAVIPENKQLFTYI